MSSKFELIDAERATLDEWGHPKFKVTKMCEWSNVSPSGYYDWRARPMSATASRREYLVLLIKKVFDDSDSTYGYRRVHATLVRWGEQASLELVRALMRQAGLVPCQPAPWRHSLTVQGPSGPIPDLVARDFTATAPGTKMVGDITYLATGAAP